MCVSGERKKKTGDSNTAHVNVYTYTNCTYCYSNALWVYVVEKWCVHRYGAKSAGSLRRRCEYSSIEYNGNDGGETFYPVKKTAVSLPTLFARSVGTKQFPTAYYGQLKKKKNLNNNNNKKRQQQQRDLLINMKSVMYRSFSTTRLRYRSCKSGTAV